MSARIEVKVVLELSIDFEVLKHHHYNSNTYTNEMLLVLFTLKEEVFGVRGMTLLIQLVDQFADDVILLCFKDFRSALNSELVRLIVTNRALINNIDRDVDLVLNEREMEEFEGLIGHHTLVAVR